MKRFVIFCLFTSSAAFGVPEDFRNWTHLGVRGVLDVNNASVPWRVGVEGRFHDNWGRLGQSVVETGIGYSLGGIIDFSVGFDWMRTPGTGATLDRDEYRPWQAIGGNIVTGGAGFMVRTKLEERIENGDLTFRFRQMFQIQWPVLFTPPTAVFMSNEIFFHFNSSSAFAAGLDQNRFMLGIKHPFAGPVQGTLAYMNQAFPNEMNHIVFLQVDFILGG